MPLLAQEHATSVDSQAVATLVSEAAVRLADRVNGGGLSEQLAFLERELPEGELVARLGIKRVSNDNHPLTKNIVAFCNMVQDNWADYGKPDPTEAEQLAVMASALRDSNHIGAELRDTVESICAYIDAHSTWDDDVVLEWPSQVLEALGRSVRPRQL